MILILMVIMKQNIDYKPLEEDSEVACYQYCDCFNNSL